MVNAELRTLHAADGTPVCNVSFDLSAQQLHAAARAAEAIRLERHRHQALSTDDVLALRELTGLSDELHMLAEPGAPWRASDRRPPAGALRRAARRARRVGPRCRGPWLDARGGSGDPPARRRA